MNTVQLLDSLQPYGLQHTRLPCPSSTPRIYSNSCRWCHPTISYSVIPFSSHLQSFPASGSFQMGQFFASGGQSIVVSASASVLPVNIQDWFPLGWTDWISWQLDGETMETVTDFILGGSKITADGDYSHEIKTLAPWKKSYDMYVFSCLTFCNPMDCSPPGFSVHGIFQARIPKWVAISSSRGSSWPRDPTYISLLHLLHWQAGSLLLAPPGKPSKDGTSLETHFKVDVQWLI